MFSIDIQSFRNNHTIEMGKLVTLTYHFGTKQLVHRNNSKAKSIFFIKCFICAISHDIKRILFLFILILFV